MFQKNLIYLLSTYIRYSDIQDNNGNFIFMSKNREINDHFKRIICHRHGKFPSAIFYYIFNVQTFEIMIIWTATQI